MSCGTPAVCFDATGPKDIVDHKINGYLAKPFDPSDLAAGIDWVLSDENRHKEIMYKSQRKGGGLF
jgi:glycosyltransferase involved in cell wall biosynthesis